MSVQKMIRAIDPNDRVALALLKEFARAKAAYDVYRLAYGRKDPSAQERKQEYLDTRSLLKKHIEGAKR